MASKGRRVWVPPKEGEPVDRLQLMAVARSKALREPSLAESDEPAFMRSLRESGFDTEGLKLLFIQEAMKEGLVVNPEMVETGVERQESEAKFAIKQAVDGLLEAGVKPRIIRYALDGLVCYVGQLEADDIGELMGDE